MHPIQLASVFFALTCCFAVFGGEVFSQKSSSDVLKFNLPSRAKMSAFSKRRFRRSPEDKETVNINPEEGPCIDPSIPRDREIKSYSVSYCRLFIQEGPTLHMCIFTLVQFLSFTWSCRCLRVMIFRFAVVFCKWDKTEYIHGLDW